MSFDLNQLSLTTDAQPLQLNHPVTEAPLFVPDEDGRDDESKPVSILLYGTASKQYRKAVDVMMKKNAKRGNKQATPDEMREGAVEFLVALAAGSTNLDLDGEAVTSPEQFRKLFSDERFSWVKAQCDSFLGTTEAFIQK